MSWETMVAKLAPTVALALNSPLEMMARNIVCESLRLPTKAKDEEIERQLSSHPDQLARIKEAENAFSGKLKDLGIDLQAILKEDKKNTRQMTFRDRVPGILAVAITIGFFATLYQVLVNGIAEKVDAMLVGSLLGTMGTAWIQLVSYYFGSSHGSERKSEMMAALKKGGMR